VRVTTLSNLLLHLWLPPQPPSVEPPSTPARGCCAAAHLAARPKLPPLSVHHPSKPHPFFSGTDTLDPHSKPYCPSSPAPLQLRLGGRFPAPPSALLPLGVCKVEDGTRILARFQQLQILLSSMVNLSLMLISKTERRNFLQPLRVVGCTSRHLIWRDDTFTFFTLARIFLQLILGRIYLALTICRRVYVRNIMGKT
jgi:hypothetical protein